MKSFHIHIKGIVQGVGFRPFVYKHARKSNLKGWVNNTTDGVHIQINTDATSADRFLESLLKNLPPLAIVTSYDIEEVNFQKYDDFEIVHSKNDTKPNLLLTPDVAMCADCKNELHHPEDRRYQYPFITCTNCGPRYSIIKKLPYDRITTTMASFKMCDACLEEYNNPMERRHFSQTNSCPDCAIEMQLYENNQWTNNFTDLDYIVEKWKEGKIVAIKGIGGFLLTCNATNAEAVNTLRSRKKRPVKPFALMYPDCAAIQRDIILKDDEKKALESIYAPIVLLPVRPASGKKNNLALEVINKGLSRVGIMLPYTPLYDLLLQKFNTPIIATSGNITDSTIIFQDEKALNELSKIADVLLLNNREIVIPQDDGVIQFSEKSRQKITLRRSRGKAPAYVNAKLELPDNTVFAAGSMLKSVFGLIDSKNLYISQYLGNTESFDAQLNYEKTFRHFRQILAADIDTVIVDKHPDYFSTRFAKELSKENKAEIFEVQHHIAHLFSVIGENNLLNCEDNILGVIWDGTGLGDDGNIWGGEFFVYEKGQVERAFHLDEFDFILGDKMPGEPRISALAIAHDVEGSEKYLKEKFTDTEWRIYQKMLTREGNLKCTSMGRLFDAVSSILLNCDVHHFEAEASMRLENMASKYYYNNKITLTDSYLNKSQIPENFIKHLFTEIIHDLDNNIEREKIAAKFHISLVDYIIHVANKLNVNKLAFSGGVFQNALLIDIINDFMRDSFDLYFQNEFSPNDEGIPFGQLMYYTKSKIIQEEKG
jgi:hydrogenase maturation protein HypF